LIGLEIEDRSSLEGHADGIDESSSLSFLLATRVSATFAALDDAIRYLLCGMEITQHGRKRAEFESGQAWNQVFEEFARGLLSKWELVRMPSK